MTDRDDIIRMAQEAGLYHFYDSEGHCTGITDARLVTEDKERWDDRLVEMLAPFAALVRADKPDLVRLQHNIMKTALEQIVGVRAIIDNLLSDKDIARITLERIKQQDEHPTNLRLPP